MFFKQYYLGCLAHASYMLGDEKSRTGIVVDPQRRLDEIFKDITVLVHCAGGYRSTIACSLLKKNGLQKTVNLLGGLGGLEKQKGWGEKYLRRSGN